MASGTQNRIMFEMALEQEEIRYREVEEAKVPCLSVTYNMKNMERLEVFFWFDEDGETLHYGSGVIAHVPEEKTEAAMRAINQANVSYRWLTFFLDRDNDIVASGDHILNQDYVGSTCRELLGRTLNICDECYSDFMRAIWT